MNKDNYRAAIEGPINMPEQRLKIIYWRHFLWI